MRRSTASKVQEEQLWKEGGVDVRGERGRMDWLSDVPALRKLRCLVERRTRTERQYHSGAVDKNRTTSHERADYRSIV